MRIVWYGTSPDYKKIYAQVKILSHDESGRLNVLGFYILTSALGLFGLLLGRILWHLVRRRNQHLRQKWDGRVFGQRGRTMDPLRLLRPALGELNNTR